MNLREPAVAAFSGLALLSILPAFVVAGRSDAKVRAFAFLVQVGAQAALVFRLGARGLAIAHLALGVLTFALVARKVARRDRHRVEPSSDSLAAEASPSAGREPAVVISLFALGVAGKIAFDHPWRVSLGIVPALSPGMGHYVALAFAFVGTAVFLLRTRAHGTTIPFATVTCAAALSLVFALARFVEPTPVFGRAAHVALLGVLTLQVLAAIFLAAPTGDGSEHERGA